MEIEEQPILVTLTAEECELAEAYAKKNGYRNPLNPRVAIPKGETITIPVHPNQRQFVKGFKVILDRSRTIIKDPSLLAGLTQGSIEDIQAIMGVKVGDD